MPNYFLTILLFSVCFLAFPGVTNGEGLCQSGATVLIPPNFKARPTQEYPFVEAGLQIFTDLQVPCSGYITEWRFLSRNNLVLGLHLGLFHRVLRRGEVRMRLMAETIIDSLYINRTSRWQRFIVDPPIPVQGGEYLGMFYDSFYTLQEMLAIPSKGNRNNYDSSAKDLKRAPTIVMKFDATDISPSTEISLIGAHRDFRVPALTAVVEPAPFEDSIEPSAPPTTTPKYFDDSYFENDDDEAALTPRTTSNFRFETTTTTIRPIMPEFYWTTQAPPPPPTLKTIPPQMYRGVVTPEPFSAPSYNYHSGDEGRHNNNNYNYDDRYGGLIVKVSMTTENPWLPISSFPAMATSEPVIITDSPIYQPMFQRDQQRTTALFARRCLYPPTALQSCDVLSIRAFFDYHNGLCKVFYGCESPVTDPNNFESMDECNMQCTADRPYQPPDPSWRFGDLRPPQFQTERVYQPPPVTTLAPPPPPPPPQRPNRPPPPFCLEPPSSLVSCDNIGRRFYYDPTASACFVFVGCDLGTERLGNNFGSAEECQRVCRAENIYTGPPIPMRAIPELQQRQQVTGPWQQPDPPTPSPGRFNRDTFDPFGMFSSFNNRLPLPISGLPMFPQQPQTQQQPQPRQRQPQIFETGDSFVPAYGPQKAPGSGIPSTSDNGPGGLFGLPNFFSQGMPRPVAPLFSRD